jgi:diguanylate cyclase (GGDEF)-like protein/PAS domain S-box-containing protein
LEVTDGGVFSVGLDGKIENWSTGAESLYGYCAEEICGQPLSRVVGADEPCTVEGLLHVIRENGVVHRASVERRHKDGRAIKARVRRALIQNEAGEIEGILECGEAVEWKDSDAPVNSALRLGLEQMAATGWMTDQELRITANWGAGLPFSKTHAGELVGRSVCELLRCADPHTTPLAQHHDALRGVSSRFEYQVKNRVLDMRLEPVRSAEGEIIGCVGVGLDITERKRTEQETLYQATHDALTGLANYREFMDSLEREVRRAQRTNHSFTVLMMDMNELKRVNDRFGHLAGNRALKRLAGAIKEQCRSTDLAARYGGDEFAVLLIDSDQGMAAQVAERIESCLRKDKEEPALSVSIGIGIFPDDGRRMQDLLEAADRHLYRRKKASQGQNVRAVQK